MHFLLDLVIIIGYYGYCNQKNLRRQVAKINGLGGTKPKGKKMKNYIKNYIIANLDNMEGTTHYICDLAGALYESDSIVGSITYNRAESEEFITEHKAEYANVLAYWKMNAGADFANKLALDYFNNPEKAHCALVFTYVDAVLNHILGQEYKGEDIWNDQREINADLIQWIKDNLDAGIDAGFADMDSYNE